jgi:hypothetical protein
MTSLVKGEPTTLIAVFMLQLLTKMQVKATLFLAKHTLGYES